MSKATDLFVCTQTSRAFDVTFRITAICRSKSKEVFLCDEESHFYAQSLVTLGLKRCRDDEQVSPEMSSSPSGVLLKT